MQSQAKTVREYLAEQTPERRRILEGVRKVIRKNLDDDFEEGMQYGMISYYVPHRVYPAGYHCDPKQPLPFAGLASQKNYLSLYLMPVYGAGEQRFREAWAKTGKKLDMGKCCVRFRKLEELALDVIGDTIRSIPAKAYIAHYESMTPRSRTAAAQKPKPKQPPVGTRAPLVKDVSKNVKKSRSSTRRTTRRSKT